MKRYKLKVKGKFCTFTSISDAARAFHIPVIPVYQRLRLGWKLRKALTAPLAPRKVRAYKPNPDVLAYKANKMGEAGATKH